MLRSAVLLLALIPCLAVERLQVSWSGKLPTQTATLKPPAVASSPRGGLAPRHVHSWNISKPWRCSPEWTLLVEIWEDRATAAAAPPGLDSRVFCPVASSQDYQTLVLDGWELEYSQWWESKGHYPRWTWDDVSWRFPWWDPEACARQLPYHRILVPAAYDDLTGPDDTWWVHAINRRRTSLPKYQVRATCAASVPCPEPLLGMGPCSGRGICKSAVITGMGQENPYEKTVICDCNTGWAGVGCEVEVPSLALDVVTPLVPVYNPDMKLIWDMSVDTPWSLLQLQVPTSARQLVLELTIDWSEADSLSVSSNFSRPRLCFIMSGQGWPDDDYYDRFHIDDFHLELSAAGRLLVLERHCIDALNLPVATRTGLQISNLSAAHDSDPLRHSHVLVMDVGTYPMQLTARISSSNGSHSSGGSSDGLICPFNCSGYAWNPCVESGCACGDRPDDTMYLGSVCEYSISFADGRSARSQRMLLEAGRTVFWVVMLRSNAYALGQFMVLEWKARGRSRLEGLSVSAFQMDIAANQSWQAFFYDKPATYAVKELCWTGSQSPILFDINECFRASPPFNDTFASYRMIGFQFKNAGASTITFTASTYRHKFKAPRRTAVLIASLVGGGTALLVVGCGLTWHQRRAQGEAGMVASHTTAAAPLHLPAPAGAATRQAVPVEVIATFPTQVYAPTAVANIAFIKAPKPQSHLTTPQPAATQTDVCTPESTPRASQPTTVEVELARQDRQSDQQGPLLAVESPVVGGAIATSSGAYGRAGSGGMESGLGSALRRVRRALSNGGQTHAAPLRPEDSTEHACAICLGEYETGEVLRRLPCLHAFHQPCIDAWMASNDTCPVCRLRLTPHPEPTLMDTGAPPSQAIWAGSMQGIV